MTESIPVQGTKKRIPQWLLALLFFVGVPLTVYIILMIVAGIITASTANEPLPALEGDRWIVSAALK